MAKLQPCTMELDVSICMVITPVVHIGKDLQATPTSPERIAQIQRMHRAKLNLLGMKTIDSHQVTLGKIECTIKGESIQKKSWYHIIQTVACRIPAWWLFSFLCDVAQEMKLSQDLRGSCSNWFGTARYESFFAKQRWHSSFEFQPTDRLKASLAKCYLRVRLAGTIMKKNKSKHQCYYHTKWTLKSSKDLSATSNPLGTALPFHRIFLCGHQCNSLCHCVKCSGW